MISTTATISADNYLARAALRRAGLLFYDEINSRDSSDMLVVEPDQRRLKWFLAV